MVLVVQTLPNTEFAQHVQPHAIGAMCWCLMSNVLQHFVVVWYGMVDVCDGYLAAEASGSSFG